MSLHTVRLIIASYQACSVLESRSRRAFFLANILTAVISVGGSSAGVLNASFVLPGVPV